MVSLGKNKSHWVLTESWCQRFLSPLPHDDETSLADSSQPFDKSNNLLK